MRITAYVRHTIYWKTPANHEGALSKLEKYSFDVAKKRNGNAAIEIKGFLSQHRSALE